MKTKKYVVWMHQDERTSTGTKPMRAQEARRLLKQEKSSITKSNGCLPEWPRYEIRKAGNPPRHLA